MFALLNNALTNDNKVNKRYKNHLSFIFQGKILLLGPFKYFHLNSPHPKSSKTCSS